MPVTEKYDLREVEPREGPGSRFALRGTPGGWASSPGESIQIAYRELLQERIAEAKVIQAEVITVPLWAVVEQNGQYKLVERGVVEGPRVFETKRTRGKFARRQETGEGAELVDRLFTGELSGVRSDALWSAALEAAQADELRGEALRQWNIALCRALLLDSGLDPVHPSLLPNPFTPHPKSAGLIDGDD